MQTMKRYLLCAAGFLALVLFSVEAQAEKRIGVFMYSEEVRYTEAAKGIKDKLGEAGYGEPKTTFMVENAGGNKAKAADLVRQFVEAKLDLILTVGTVATIAMSREIRDVPVVFSMVYDPVQSGIAKAWESSGNNTTGVSSKVPLSRLMEGLRTLKPINRLAVLYTPGEKNSELQLVDLLKLQRRYSFKVVPVRLTTIEEFNQLSGVFRSTDAVYVTGSDVVNSQIQMIVDMAAKAQVITISHLDDLIEKGVLLGVCTNSYSAGQVAGEQAVKILKGAKPSSIPVEYPKNPDVILNMKTVKRGQFQIPPNLMKMVTKKIE